MSFKTVIFSLVFWTSMTFCFFGQEREQDSLLKILEQHPQKDSERVDLLISISENSTNINPQDALQFSEDAFTLSTQINWLRGQVLSLRQEGVIHYSMGNNIEAMETWQNALRIAEPLKDQIVSASLNNNLANIYADLGQFDKALIHYQNYLTISKELGDRSGQIRALTNMGLVYSENKKIEKGIEYLEEALKIAKEEKNQFFIAAIVNNLGIAYKRIEDYPRSLKSFQEASQIADEIDNKYIKSSALNSIGEVYLKLDNYKLARVNSEDALAIAQEIDAVEWQMESWENLNKVFEHNKNHEKALYAYRSFIGLRDSIAGEAKKDELTRKEMQFQLEKQQVISSNEIKRQRLIKKGAIISGIFLLLASIIGYILYKKKRDAVEKKRIAEFKSKVAETELIALRSQMNPHFIFNALNSISDYIENRDVKIANEYLLKFSKLTRAILENSEKKQILLSEELELIQLYVEIESLRLNNKLSYTVKIDPEIDVENTLIPPLILQPFIENSIWHGIAPKEADGNLCVAIKKEGDSIVFDIDDDGVGRSALKAEGLKNNSMGIQITKNRLEIINLSKKIKSNLKIIDKKQGLRVALNLPLELRF